ncbi:MAG: helix-turn-helix transcriptional regulator [Candidatus Diapherotrites archaeon]|nr:helix-turn-helix transcriptional regulator [Candidatus Diapherotrites archaeon]
MHVRIPSDVKKDLEPIRKAVVPKIIPLFCLALINEKPRYGYDIIKEAARVKDEMVGLPMKKTYTNAAVIYPTLHKLEKDGLLESKWDERRKVYHITRKGKRRLDISRGVWKASIDAQMKMYKKMFER